MTAAETAAKTAVAEGYRRVAPGWRRWRVAFQQAGAAVTDALVANSIRHAANPGERFIEVSLIPTQRGVRVQVKDGDSTPPVLRSSDPDDVAGRGLQLVDTIARAWGCQPDADGKTIWADVEAD